MEYIELIHDEIPPVMDGSVEIDTNGSPVVDQLWGAVGKLMSYTSRLIEPLFNTVWVTAEDQSPLCRILFSPPTCGKNSSRIYKKNPLVTLVVLLNQ